VEIFPRKEQFEFAERKQERSRRSLCVGICMTQETPRPKHITQQTKEMYRGILFMKKDALTTLKIKNIHFTNLKY